MGGRESANQLTEKEKEKCKQGQIEATPTCEKWSKVMETIQFDRESEVSEDKDIFL